MGWLRDKWNEAKDWICEKKDEVVETIKDFIDDTFGRLGKKDYKSTSIEAHIDVDKELAEFRIKIEPKISLEENECMKMALDLFSDLKEKLNRNFPDLVEIISVEQKKAESELKGYIMGYVKEHLSKNNAKFVIILKMNPGTEKTIALNEEAERIISEARDSFIEKVEKHTENILRDFSERIDIRLMSKTAQMNRHIDELKSFEYELEKGNLELEEIKDRNLPAMEAAACIIYALEQEI